MLPLVSVIVSVHDWGGTFPACLSALLQSRYAPFEVLLVDDHSQNPPAQQPSDTRVRILRLPRRSGPAAARNRGAQAALGSIPMFIDSDVRIYPDTLGHVVDGFARHPHVTAIFGSYDTSPTGSNFASVYKNLAHHYVHQTSEETATTFWAGCGAIRRRIFLAMGGFDESYGRPSIEDIELGSRLHAQGCRIILAKHIQVTHMKTWTVSTLLYTDIFRRAIPWARLMLARGKIANDLNLSWDARSSAILLCVAALSLPATFFFPTVSLCSLLASLTTLYALNRSFYRFLTRIRGWRFAILGVCFHWLYFAYSTVAFAIACTLHALSRRHDRTRRGSPRADCCSTCPTPSRAARRL